MDKILDKNELKEQILNLLSEKNDSLAKDFLSFDDIEYFLHLDNYTYSDKDIMDAMDELQKDYIIHKSKKDRFGLLSSFNLYLGTIILKKQGYGFFTSDKLEEDVFIPEADLENALDNDTVIAWVDPYVEGLSKKREGRIFKVIRHNSDLICKVIKKNFSFDNKALISEMYPDVEIKVNDYKLAVVDDIVLLKIKDVDLVNKNQISGEIIKIIGNTNDPNIDVLSITYKYNLNNEFDIDVLNDVENVTKIYNDSLESEINKRRRVNELIITIDGEDAKDLDDAVSVRKLKNGNYFLGVYIADVSWFVRRGTKLDEEAFNRGTSVYLTDRVIPMLPHKLCNDLCSLNEHIDKFVIACEMEIDKSGKVINKDIFDAVINSTHRMTYTNVNKIIEYNKTKDESLLEDIKQYEDIFDMVKDMNELSHVLNKMRTLRGSLNFEIPEAKIICDSNGQAIDVVLRERYDAEKLIEEFMLIANETVAKTISDLELPFIYRVHDEPNSLKMEKFNKILKNTKYSIKSKGKNINPKDLQNLLNEVNEQDNGISTMLLRMMAKAVYSSHNIGHYGLASKCYTHFTSPIRRYPDLLVHRLIRLYLLDNSDFYNNYTSQKEVELANEIEEIARHSSEQEVNATKCEYEVEDMKKAEYMESHIGETYEGRISSVTNFGLYVTLANTIEGLVHVRSLKDDYYVYNESLMALIGRDSKKAYRLGDKVKVTVVDANKETSEIEFKISGSGNNNRSMIKYNKISKNTSVKGKKKNGKRRN